MCSSAAAAAFEDFWSAFSLFVFDFRWWGTAADQSGYLLLWTVVTGGNTHTLDLKCCFAGEQSRGDGSRQQIELAFLICSPKAESFTFTTSDWLTLFALHSWFATLDLEEGRGKMIIISHFEYFCWWLPRCEAQNAGDAMGKAANSNTRATAGAPSFPLFLSTATPPVSIFAYCFGGG